MSNPLQKFFSSSRNRVAVIIAAIAVTTVTVSSLVLYNSNKNTELASKDEKQDTSKIAKASPVPSSTIFADGRFAITYEYSNDQGDVENNQNEALVTIKTSKYVTIVPDSVTDRFDDNGNGTYTDEPVRYVNNSFIQQSNESGVEQVLTYRPRSATNTTPPGNGQSTRGPVLLPLKAKGVITFRAIVSSEIFNTGVKSDDVIKVATLNFKTWNSSAASNPSTDDTKDVYVKILAPRSLQLTHNDLGNGTCVDQVTNNTEIITIPNLATCTIPIVGTNAGGYSIPSTLTVGIGTATPVTASKCTIQTNGNTRNLVCTDIPTENNTPGMDKPLNVRINGLLADKGDVDLASPVNSTTIQSISCASPRVVGQPTDCTVNLSGFGPYQIPSGFKIRIGNNGTPTLCSTQGTVSTGNSFTCTSIPTAGNNAGINQVYQSTDNYTTSEGTIELTPVTNQITNDKITSVVCNPKNLYVGGTPASANCYATVDTSNPNTQYQGGVTFSLPSGESCTVTVTPGQAQTSTCALTPTTPGLNREVSFQASGSTTPVKSSEVLNVYSLGTPVNTVANPLTGVVGQTMPTINLTNAVVPNGTVVNFTPNGCTTPIPGTITNNVWTANPASTVVPQCVNLNPTTGTAPNAHGVLSATNFASVNIPHDFEPAPTLGIFDPNASPITGIVGQAMPNIPLANANANGKTAQFIPQGCTAANAINGTINGQVWIPDAGSVIPACATVSQNNIPTTGILTSTQIPGESVAVPSIFKPAPTIGQVTPNTVITGVKGLENIPSIPLTGSNVPNGTPASFTPAGCTTAISGTINNGVWIPDTATVIPQCATVGPQNGTLYSPSTKETINVPTNFSNPTLAPQTNTPITGVIGDPMPNIPVNTNLPDGTQVQFTPAGCTTALNGTIQSNNGQKLVVFPSNVTIPQCATTGPQNGTLTEPKTNTTTQIPTNFSPKQIPIDEPNVDVGKAIQSISCVDQLDGDKNIFVSGSMVCTGQLKPEYTAPANSNNPLKVKLNNTGATEATCTTTTNPTTRITTFSCAAANVGTEVGTARVVQAASGNNGFTNTTETINVISRPLDESDLPKMTWTCADNNTATAGQQNYTCTSTLPVGTTLPSEGLKLGVGTNPAGTCQITNTLTNTITCTNIPVTNNTGQQPLNGQIGNRTPVDTNTKIQVKPKPSLGDPLMTPITGVVGQAMPIIPLNNATLVDGTPVSFTPQNATGKTCTPIWGQILTNPNTQQKYWQAYNNALVPDCVLTENLGVGTLKAMDNTVAPLEVQHIFTPAAKLGTPTGAGGLTGPINGNVGGSIPLAGNTLLNGTPATYTNGNNCTIQGQIINNAFVPNSNQLVGAGCPTGPNTNGKITANGQTVDNAPSNFSPAEALPTLSIDNNRNPGSGNVTFNPDQMTSIFGINNLQVSVSGTSKQPTSCKIIAKPNASSAQAIDLTSSVTYSASGCSATLPADKQITPFFTFDIEMVLDGKTYSALNVGYKFREGTRTSTLSSVFVDPDDYPGFTAAQLLDLGFRLGRI